MTCIKFACCVCVCLYVLHRPGCCGCIGYSKVTSCNACYYNEAPREIPSGCHQRCDGLTEQSLPRCLTRWESCIRKQYEMLYSKDQVRQFTIEILIMLYHTYNMHTVGNQCISVYCTGYINIVTIT